jgi:NTP pyrophosphatase (non-canonical NTP hydrolase)
MRTSIEDEVVKLFNEKYGIDFESRLRKLREETDELLEAAGDMEDNPCPGTISHFIDELSDVQGVLSHIHSLFALDNDKAILNCIIKNKCREIDPTYLKSKKK